MAAELVHTALLPAVPPFALGAALRAMSGFAPCAGDQLVTADRVRKAFPVSGTEAAVVEVAGRPDGAPGVALSVFAQRALSPPETGALESRIRRWLSLDDDLAPFFSIARRHLHLHVGDLSGGRALREKALWRDDMARTGEPPYPVAG